MQFCADLAENEPSVHPRRRRRPRYTLRSLAYVKLDQGNGGIVRDLTESGIAVQAVAPLHPGQEVSLRFDLLSPRVRVETRGRIAWADSNGQSGIQFLELPPRIRRALKDWLLLQIFAAAVISGRDSIFLAAETPFVASSALPRSAIILNPPMPAESSPPVEWGLFSFSAKTFSVCIDTLVVLCAILLFSVSSLAVMRGMPAWPLAAALVLTASAIFVAVYQLLFSDLLCGATPGTRLAFLVSRRHEDEEQDHRFR